MSLNWRVRCLRKGGGIAVSCNSGGFAIDLIVGIGVDVAGSP